MARDLSTVRLGVVIIYNIVSKEDSHYTASLEHGKAGFLKIL